MDGIEVRDKQVGLTMAWHGKTDVQPVITKDYVFPWHVILAPASYTYQQKASDGTLVNVVQPHGKTNDDGKYQGWVVPIASDDLKPFGTQDPPGQPINSNSFTARSPGRVWEFRDRIFTGVPNTVVSAGTVNNRGKYFISTLIDQLSKFKLQDGTEIEILLNSMGALDKSIVEQHSFSSTRIVCQNTLMMSFLGDKVRFRYRHSKKMEEIMESDEIVLQSAASAGNEIQGAFNTLLNYACSKDKAEKVYAGLIVSDGQESVSKRARAMIDEHLQCFESGDGNVGKTEFDLLNGWTQLKTHGYTDSEKSAWDTYESSEFGAYMNAKIKLAVMLLKEREQLDKTIRRGEDLLANTQ